MSYSSIPFISDEDVEFFTNDNKPQEKNIGKVEIQKDITMSNGLITKDEFEKMFPENINQPLTLLPKPVKYDDTGKSTKIAERCPLFNYANLIDDVLEDFGGVEEIIKYEWDNDKNEGLIICLMKDWRIFRYVFKGSEYSGLSQEDRIKKLNRECQIFEDFDDWGHWEDLNSLEEVDDKQKL